MSVFESGAPHLFSAPSE